MDQICDRNQCTGCGLCRNICPKGAISIVESEDTGHFVPYIDQKLCVDCNLCKKMCPGLKKPEHKKQIKTFAAWRKDIGEIKGSSSGGVAASLYENAIKEGYYIVGTYLDESFHAKMKVTNKAEDIELFKGSKYIQADAGTVYKEILELLKKGEKLLFIGTPCQCAAMKALTKERYDDSILIVELICHGTPSQKSFQDYIHYLSQKKKKKITKVLFRSQWGEELSLYSGEKVFWKYKAYEDDFLVAFQTGLLHNLPCYECKYANKDRTSDLTIGDFWKIGQKKEFERPKCKVSVVVANTEKGLCYIQKCNQLILQERDYQEAMDGNPNLYRPSTKHPQREEFWKIYEKEGIPNAYQKTIGKRLKKIRLRNSMKGFIKSTIKFFVRPLLRK